MVHCREVSDFEVYATSIRSRNQEFWSYLSDHWLTDLSTWAKHARKHAVTLGTTAEHISDDSVIYLQSVIIKLCLQPKGFMLPDNASVTATKASRPCVEDKLAKCGTRITGLERQQNCHDPTGQLQLKPKTVTEASWPWAVDVWPESRKSASEDGRDTKTRLEEVAQLNGQQGFRRKNRLPCALTNFPVYSHNHNNSIAENP
ncbi:hypothetical protein CLF_107387 [Clonorchis sinensis]|uniref:Uncharacterized protein n=1 Tax=Clonorchis sinensis TaxID=79923 RepID=G7YGQ2_CLOSI|nr:hypothetical protein CLF_107387 [Clonorchis sinensis]